MLVKLVPPLVSRSGMVFSEWQESNMEEKLVTASSGAANLSKREWTTVIPPNVRVVIDGPFKYTSSQPVL